MLSRLNFNEFTNGLNAACRTAVVKASEWSGHAVAVLKSGTSSALPYLQDQRLAVVALIVVNFLLLTVINMISHAWNECCPDDTALKRGIRDVVDVTQGIGILTAGVIGFSKSTRLPLSPLIISGITIASVVAYCYLLCGDE